MTTKEQKKGEILGGSSNLGAEAEVEGERFRCTLFAFGTISTYLALNGWLGVQLEHGEGVADTRGRNTVKRRDRQFYSWRSVGFDSGDERMARGPKNRDIR